jgi:DNA polymerase (family X)
MSDGPRYPLDTMRRIAFTRVFYPAKDHFGPSLKIAIAGSIRRKRAMVGDIDVLVQVEDRARKNWFRNLITTAQNGETLISGTISGLPWVPAEVPIQIWFATPQTWGARLLETTGPYSFNVKMRSIAKRNGLMLSGLGLKEASARDYPADALSEGELMYAVLGVRIEPEMRE